MIPNKCNVVVERIVWKTIQNDTTLDNMTFVAQKTSNSHVEIATAVFGDNYDFSFLWRCCDSKKYSTLKKLTSSRLVHF